MGRGGPPRRRGGPVVAADCRLLGPLHTIRRYLVYTDLRLGNYGLFGGSEEAL